MVDIMKQEMIMIETCPCCKSKSHYPWLKAMGFELVTCANCKHHYATEVYLSEILATDYYGKDSQYFDSRTMASKQQRFRDYRVLLGQAWNRKGRVLDVGCNAGEFLSLFAAEGWEVAGIEISRPAAEYAQRNIPGPIWIGSVEDALPKGNTFDLITITHVLEHLQNPVQVLTRLASALRPGGHLLVEVPNANDAFLSIWRGYYRPLCPGDHLSFFTEKSLRKTLENAGMMVQKTICPTHARDIVYTPLLSTLDLLRTFRGRRSPTMRGGVAVQTRYRGRFRRPLKQIIDSTIEVFDPLICSIAQQITPTQGPVLIMTATLAEGSTSGQQYDKGSY